MGTIKLTSSQLRQIILSEATRRAAPKSFKQAWKDYVAADAMALKYAQLEALLERIDDGTASSKEVQSAYKAAEAAMQASDVVSKLDNGENEPPGGWSKFEQRSEELWDMCKELKREAEKLSTSDKGFSALGKKGFKKITLSDMERIYRAALSEYSSSYAMMADDSFRGAESASKKLGISPVYDWGWFPLIHGFVKAHKRWSDVPERTKSEMVAKANEELLQSVSRKRNTRW